MGSSSIDIVEYGSGLAIAVVELDDGVEVSLRRPSSDPTRWEAHIDVSRFNNWQYGSIPGVVLDLDHHPTLKLTRSSPEEALEAMALIYKEYR